MKPDPYKRARSRQYKAKHGLFEDQKHSKQELNLPTNISDENLSLSPDLDSTPTTDYNNILYLLRSI